MLISDVIDEWLSLQRNWIYLENIFNAQDIQRQLPVETLNFFQVNKFWRDIMIKTKKFPSVLNSCYNLELLTKFKYNNKILDNI
jgi:dynein heavy chain